jgi:hypothetical protein
METVDMICKHLDNNNISYFRDIFDISISSTFTQTLADAILSCRLVLFIASKNSFASNYTSKEVTFAYQNHIAIMPLLIDNTPMPTNYSFMFSDVQCMSLQNTSMQRLIGDIDNLLAGNNTKIQAPKHVPLRTQYNTRKGKKRGCLGTIFMAIGILATLFFALVIIDTNSRNSSNTQVGIESIDGDFYHRAGSRKLTEEDGKGKTKHELRIMRNEIYARHGYIFQDAMLRDHFLQKPWYTPQTKNVALSSIEQYNVLFIKSYEQQ